MKKIDTAQKNENAISIMIIGGVFLLTTLVSIYAVYFR